MRSVSRGTLYRQQGSQNWFVKFYVDGELKRETTGTPDRGQAEAFLRRCTEHVLDKTPGGIRILGEGIDGHIPATHGRMPDGVASAVEHGVDIKLAGDL